MRSGSWVLGPLLLLLLSMLLSYECRHHSSLERLRHKLRIAGGTKVSSSDFPAYVGLKIQKTNSAGEFYSNCGGVMVARDKLLTANHCFESGTIGDIEVSNNDLAPDFWPDYGEHESVLAEKFCRSKYFSSPQGRDINDYAVVKLRKPLRGVIPAALPKHELPIGSREHLGKTFALGTGHIGKHSPGRQLKALEVKRVECNKKDDHESHICFKSSNSKHHGDTCVGDSGGPILALEGNSQVVYGLTSYGGAICMEGYPGVSVNTDIFSLQRDINDLLDECD